MKASLASVAFLVLGACSSQPSKPTIAASPPSVAPAAPVSAPASVAASVDPNDKQIKEVVKRALRSGYQVAKSSDGSKRYCTEQTKLGSHITDKVCYNTDQLVDLFARQDLDQDQRMQGSACGNGCGGSH